MLIPIWIPSFITQPTFYSLRPGQATECVHFFIPHYSSSRLLNPRAYEISSLCFSRPLEKSLQKQVSVMSMNLSCKLDDLQSGNRYMETSVALCEIRTQLQELTKSVESCQSEVSEVSSFPTVKNKPKESESAFLKEKRPALFGTQYFDCQRLFLMHITS